MVTEKSQKPRARAGEITTSICLEFVEQATCQLPNPLECNFELLYLYAYPLLVCLSLTSGSWTCNLSCCERGYFLFIHFMYYLHYASFDFLLIFWSQMYKNQIRRILGGGMNSWNMRHFVVPISNWSEHGFERQRI